MDAVSTEELQRAVAATLAALCLTGVVVAGTGVASAGAAASGASAGEHGTSPDELEGSLQVHYLDVGQADAAVVIGPDGETLVIDTGGWRSDGDAVLSYLDELGVERIDHLVTTHAHADHVGGHAAVIETYETERDGVGAVWDPGVGTTSQTYEDYLDAVEDHDVTLYEAREGDRIPIEGANATLVNPPADSDRPDDLHYNSLGVVLERGNATFLFTGDAERDAERRMVDEHVETLNADVLQAGHHGSETSSSPRFLDAVDPAAVVVSSGYDSQYGHPHEETLGALDERDVPTLWTGSHGTVVASTDGDEIAIYAQDDDPTAPDALRDGDETEGTPTRALERLVVIDAEDSRTGGGSETGDRLRRPFPGNSPAEVTG